MEDLHFESKVKLNQYLKSAEPLGRGFQGDVYKKGDLVIKKYTLPLSFYDFDELEFKDEDIEGFYFAKAKIYVRDKKNGVITDYANGVPIARKKLSYVEIVKLFSAIKRLNAAVDKLCDANIRVLDANQGNILFNGERFNVIDTLSYFRARHLSKDELKFLNMKSIFQEVFGGVIPSTLYDYLSKIGFFNDEAMLIPIEHLKEILEHLRNEINCDFGTFSEAKKLMIEGKRLRH